MIGKRRVSDVRNRQAQRRPPVLLEAQEACLARLAGWIGLPSPMTRFDRQASFPDRTFAQRLLARWPSLFVVQGLRGKAGVGGRWECNRVPCNLVIDCLALAWDGQRGFYCN
ncbi:phosphoribosyltransferase [Anopheles sinensis]|uniref:Phosphoribosyltransferase n=1 Tax=Anopheles sinensis TaxID=74873 RepID=A0A084VWR2_ANOSI|nr:phosphoribosyltransferase [Anopheles sinensis]